MRRRYYLLRRVTENRTKKNTLLFTLLFSVGSIKFHFLTGSKANSPYPGSTDADIIELHDLRMSPLPSIRNRSGLVNASSTPGAGKDHDPAKFPPSFRISRAAAYNTHGRNSGLRYRGPRPHKPKVCEGISRQKQLY